MLRAILMACLIALFFGCASKKAQDVKEAPWTGDSGLAPPSLQQPDAASARESDVSPIRSSADAAVPASIPAPATEVPPAKLEQLGEMSDSTPGAANVIQRPCDLENCAVVLAIGTHQAAESVDQDDGGPGLYMPQGMYSAETAGQPGSVDCVGRPEGRPALGYLGPDARRRGAGDTAAQRAAISRRRSGAGQREQHIALELRRLRPAALPALFSPLPWLPNCCSETMPICAPRVRA